MPVKIITDSTCDIPEALRYELDIEIIPLTVSFGDEQYIDGVNLSIRDFYEKLAVAKTLPKSSQPSPEKFYDLFEKYVDQGYDIVCILISSGLSGTCQSASIAKEQLGRGNIVIVDSKSTSWGMSALVVEAVKLLNQGKSAQEIAEMVEQKKDKVSLLVAIDTLKYVVMGGRLSVFNGVVGTVLGVKPIVKLIDGLVVNISKVRSMKRAIIEMVDMCEKKYSGGQTYIVHSDKPELADDMLQTIKSRMGLLPKIYEVGITIGTHAGPNCVGLVFFG